MKYSFVLNKTGGHLVLYSTVDRSIEQIMCTKASWSQHTKYS